MLLSYFPVQFWLRIREYEILNNGGFSIVLKFRVFTFYWSEDMKLIINWGLSWTKTGKFSSNFSVVCQPTRRSTSFQSFVGVGRRSTIHMNAVSRKFRSIGRFISHEGENIRIIMKGKECYWKEIHDYWNYNNKNLIALVISILSAIHITL